MYDVVTERALVVYDSQGGLSSLEAKRASRHFNFLHKGWKFTLDRNYTKSPTSGCLHLDKKGGQRMEMGGIHHRSYNITKRPKRRQIANRNGDLDMYAVHENHPTKFTGSTVHGILNDIASRIRALLPTASAACISAMATAKLQSRLYTQMDNTVMSDDLLVHNWGVSAAYHSPPHKDKKDIGWTFALACKCCTHSR